MAINTTFVFFFDSVEYDSCSCALSLYMVLLNSDWLLRVSFYQQRNISFAKECCQKDTNLVWH